MEYKRMQTMEENISDKYIYDSRETSQTILVVDDELYNRLFMEALLSNEGWKVIFAEDGEEAIDKTLEYSPTLILMDVNMPKLNGIEATKHIHLQCPEIPIIMFSGNISPNIIEKAYNAGACDYLPKPVPNHILIDYVYKYLTKIVH